MPAAARPLRRLRRETALPGARRLRARAEVLAPVQPARRPRRHQRHRTGRRHPARPPPRRRHGQDLARPADEHPGGRLMAKEFLLEIGTEEIPDWMIQPALAQMRELFAKLLADHELAGEVTAVDATPRRLVLRASGHPAQAEDAHRDADRSAVGRRRAGRRRFRPPSRRRRPKRSARSRPRRASTSRSARRRRAAQTIDILAESLPGPHPQDPLAEDDVLDRQGRRPLHPAHPLDRRPVRRPGGAVRDRRCRERPHDHRPSPAGRKADPRSPSPTTPSNWRRTLSCCRPTSAGSGSATASRRSSTGATSRSRPTTRCSRR